MERILYFENIKLNLSPLLQIPYSLENIFQTTANNEIEELLSFANRLSNLGTATSKARAAFIRLEKNENW
jgi:hypothetical protein